MQRIFLCGTRKVYTRPDGRHVVQCATCDDVKSPVYHDRQDAIDRCVKTSGKPCKCSRD